ncbi:g6647 [Coccomyxa viridis]|uniref:G6647 protein n=1 Tax=Coccomyxa viridis TaxID=1274662 RepID=A0ABP1G2E7_9CHLO
MPVCTPSANLSDGTIYRTEHGDLVYEPTDCYLRRLTADEARRCLEGRHVAFIGDSVTRYQYISLAYFLGKKRPLERNGSLRGSPSLTWEKEWPTWDEYFARGSAILANAVEGCAEEECDCYRPERIHRRALQGYLREFRRYSLQFPYSCSTQHPLKQDQLMLSFYVTFGQPEKADAEVGGEALQYHANHILEDPATDIVYNEGMWMINAGWHTDRMEAFLAKMTKNILDFQKAQKSLVLYKTTTPYIRRYSEVTESYHAKEILSAREAGRIVYADVLRRLSISMMGVIFFLANVSPQAFGLPQPHRDSAVLKVPVGRHTLPNDLEVVFPETQAVFEKLDAIVLAGGIAQARWSSISGFPEQVDYYARTATSPTIRTVCEVGFNAGFSTAVWLTSNPLLRVISFDLPGLLGDYGKACSEFLQEQFPDRLEMHWGSSLDLVPSYIASHSHAGNYAGPECNLVHIDGDHAYNGVKADFYNMLPMMNCNTLLLFDDVFDDEESGPTQLWRELKALQLVEELDSFYTSSIKHVQQGLPRYRRASSCFYSKKIFHKYSAGSPV